MRIPPFSVVLKTPIDSVLHLPATTTSADFCAFSVIFRWRLLLSEHFAQISPGTTRFFPSIHLPHLSRMIPCSFWASACVAVLPSCVTSYVVSVRQARGLPVVSLFPHPASFRFHLAMDTLAFGYILPTTGRIRDFHPLETCAAGRTEKATLRQYLISVAFIYQLHYAQPEYYNACQVTREFSR